MKNILVTGTAGFIGFHLSQALLKQGDSVTGIDNINHYYDVDLKRVGSHNWEIITISSS